MEKNTNKSAIKKKRFLMELSPAEMMGWAALLVFICGWFFILGIFVGRGLVPVPGEDKAFNNYFPEPEEIPLAGPMTPAEDKPAAQVPEKPAARSEPEAPKTEAAVPPVADPPRKTPIEKRVQNAVKEKPEELGDKIFTIQVAALRERQTADHLFKKLKNQKYEPHDVKAALSDGVTWYRLQCGQFANHDEAAPVIERLRKDGYSPILVRR